MSSIDTAMRTPTSLLAPPRAADPPLPDRHEVSVSPRNAAFSVATALLVPGVALLFRRSPPLAVLAGLGTAVAAVVLRSQTERWFTEQAAYVIVARHGDLEIRRYDPVVFASTEVESLTWRAGLSAGFHLLAAYLRGGNAGKEALPMTAPVTHGPSGTSPSGKRRFRVSFLMPKGRRLSSLPRPLDVRVRLEEQPARRVAVLRYDGLFTEELAERKQAELLRAVQAAGLVACAPPRFAGYDPPTVLPFFRRNEAWVEVKSAPNERLW